MVDAVLLLVDAVEGVMPQTRFVVGKALAHGSAAAARRQQDGPPRAARPRGRGRGLRPARRNGRDRSAARLPHRLRLGQARVTASLDPDEPGSDLRPLLEAIVEHAPPPVVDVDGPLQFQAVTLDYDEFVGRLVIGRVERGRLERGATVVTPGAGAGEPEDLSRDQAARGPAGCSASTSMRRRRRSGGDRRRRLHRDRRHHLRPRRPRGAAADPRRSPDDPRAILCPTTPRSRARTGSSSRAARSAIVSGARRSATSPSRSIRRTRRRPSWWRAAASSSSPC